MPLVSSTVRTGIEGLLNIRRGSVLRFCQVVCAAALASVISGCALFPSRPVTGHALAKLPPPIGAENFVVKSGDALRIRIWPDDHAVSGDYPIEDTGLAYIPRLGPVSAANRTVSELRADLRERYATEAGFRTPVISVTALFPVSVLGAVENPGVYTIDPTRGAFDVITMAGGLREDAVESEISIVRGSGEISVYAVETGSASGIQLQSGDRILVPLPRRQVLGFDDMRAMAQLLISSITLWRVLAR